MSRFKAYIFAAEGQAARDALKLHNYNYTAAARWLGITSKTLHRLKHSHGLEGGRHQRRLRIVSDAIEAVRELDELMGKYVRLINELEQVQKDLYTKEREFAKIKVG